jgi:hypothetical protein
MGFRNLFRLFSRALALRMGRLNCLKPVSFQFLSFLQVHREEEGEGEAGVFIRTVTEKSCMPAWLCSSTQCQPVMRRTLHACLTSCSVLFQLVA